MQLQDLKTYFRVPAVSGGPHINWDPCEPDDLMLRYFARHCMVTEYENRVRPNPLPSEIEWQDQIVLISDAQIDAWLESTTPASLRADFKAVGYDESFEGLMLEFRQQESMRGRPEIEFCAVWGPVLDRQVRQAYQEHGLATTKLYLEFFNLNHKATYDRNLTEEEQIRLQELEDQLGRP
jgi:hypothetical protein